MKTSTTATAILLSFAMITLSVSDALAQGRGGGKGGGGGNLAVSVTFENASGDGMKSDGLGAYSNAQIDKSGNLAFGFGSGKRNKPGLRKVFFDFRDCLSSCIPPRFDVGGFGFGVTYGNMYTGGVDMRSMAVGETRNDLSLYGAIKPNTQDDAFRYGFDPEDARCPGSTFVSVTRSGSDTWVIEAGPDDVLCLREGGNNAVQRGLYRVTFRITIQAVSIASTP